MTSKKSAKLYIQYLGNHYPKRFDDDIDFINDEPIPKTKLVGMLISKYHDDRRAGNIKQYDKVKTDWNLHNYQV